MGSVVRVGLFEQHIDANYKKYQSDNGKIDLQDQPRWLGLYVGYVGVPEGSLSAAQFSLDRVGDRAPDPHLLFQYKEDVARLHYPVIIVVSEADKAQYIAAHHTRPVG